jgi:hypothetical protein
LHGQRWPHPFDGHARKQVVFLPRLRGTLSRRPCVPSWTNPTGEKAKCSCPSRPRKPGSEHRGCRIPSPSKRPFATRPAPAPPQSFFSREAHPLQKPPQGGFAKALAGHLVRRKWRLSSTVAAVLVRTSSSRSFLVSSSALGGLPPPFLGVRGSPREASLE